MKLNDRVRQCIRERDSLLCVGLDVDPQKIPAHIIKKEDPIFLFNKLIIDATADFVVAYKPNLAFYEALGQNGWDILKRTVDYIPEGILKIGDAKRGDIGSTARKYAQSLFDLGFDAVTVNPYLGWDSVEPFVQDENRGIFVLCLTSNPGSKDFQYLSFKGESLYHIIAKKSVEWNRRGNCGLVVGATHPDEVKTVRDIAPDLSFLIPGIGAQGGDLETVVLSGTDPCGEMAIINSSRNILYASPREDFAEVSRRESKKLRDRINDIRRKKETK
ncbi:orotidine-5'-phosphate decarboxylase [bacterium]|nr:orotidine-5'-phosphate decarboxylase [bacterium]